MPNLGGITHPVAQEQATRVGQPLLFFQLSEALSSISARVWPRATPAAASPPAVTTNAIASEATRDARRQTKDPGILRGIGMGAAVWYNTGGTGPKATVTLHRDGSAEVGFSCSSTRIDQVWVIRAAVGSPTT